MRKHSKNAFNLSLACLKKGVKTSLRRLIKNIKAIVMIFECKLYTERAAKSNLIKDIDI